MLLQPRQSYGFAKYTYRAVNEILLGYEYENKPPRQIGWNNEAGRDKLAAYTLALLPSHFKVNYESFGNGLSGCEIKSVVAPLFLHKQFWNRYVSKLPLCTEKNSADNPSGIHVSISRTAYTESVKLKVFAFLHDPANRPHFFKMSKRTKYSFDLNCPSNPRGETIWVTAYSLPPDRYGYRGGRYEYPAIPVWPSHYNIINNENLDRFEFRLFAAHPTLLLPALEMCDALFKMANDYDAITMQLFRDYIACFKKYEHIKDHCIATLDHSPS